MSPFIETIRIENGRPSHLSLHQARMETTRSRFFPQAQPLSLHKLLSDAPRSSVGRIKARIVYGADGVVEKSYQPYILRRIERLRLVIDNEIDYAYKSTDRQSLLRLLERRGDCDDILIVRRGLLTDTSFTNIAAIAGSPPLNLYCKAPCTTLFSRVDSWSRPISLPLLYHPSSM